MKGYSLHVGVGFVDEDRYNSNKALNSAENDATFLHKIARNYCGYVESHLLLSSLEGIFKATYENFSCILEQLIYKINSIGEEAYLFISFSGHGTQHFPGKESWKKSEFLCFYDRLVLEHEIKAMLLKLKSFVKCFIVVDACNGGGIEQSNMVLQGFNKMKIFERKKIEKRTQQKSYRILAGEEDKFQHKFLSSDTAKTLIENKQKNNFEYEDLIAETPEVRSFKYFRSQICFFTACAAGSSTKDGSENSCSLFTSAIESAWNKGQFTGNYNDLFIDITRKYNPDSGPIMTGSQSNFFLNSIPFFFNNKSAIHNLYQEI